jgi:3-oxoacyl-(acyl-carrier-protein) synthase III
MAGTYIVGWGHHHPDELLTNEHLVATVDTSDEWIVGHTGIRERRKAPPEVDTSDLAVSATERALAAAGWSAIDPDLYLCATSTPDFLAPSTASLVCNKLGMRAAALDVNASCSGFVFGLSVADGLLRTGAHRRVVLTAADKYTRVVDPLDRRFAIFWGDGAGTVAMSRERPAGGGLELLDVTLDAHNEDALAGTTPVRNGWFSMDGRTIKPIASRLIADGTEEMLRRHGLQIGDLRAFMAHQMNGKLLEALAERLGLRDDQHWHNVETFGNQACAGVCTTLCGGLDEHRADLRDGDLVVCSVVGLGFSAGTALLRWVS